MAKKPSAPTSVHAELAASGTPLVVTWTRGVVNATYDAPTNHYIDRAERIPAGSTSSYTWVQLAKVSGTTTSYKSPFSNNSAYVYRVRATNSAGKATSATSNIVYTRPNVPDELVTYRAGANIVLTAILTWIWSGTVLVWHSENDGESYGLLDRVKLPASSPGYREFNYTHFNASGSTSHIYKLQIETTQTPGGLQTSALSQPSTISRALQTPASPTITAPTGNILFNSDEPSVDIRWRHNSLDGSSQVEAEVRFRKVGDVQWYYFTPGNVNSHTITPISEKSLYEVQARTRGAYLDGTTQGDRWSPWSTSRQFSAFVSPSVVITNPETDESVINSSFVNVEASIYPGYEVGTRLSTVFTLFRDGRQVEQSSEIMSGSIGGGVSSVSWKPTVLLDNETDYSVSVSSMDTSDLVAGNASRLFFVDYVKPPIPTAELSSNTDFGSVIIDVTNVEEPDTEESDNTGEIEDIEFVDEVAFIDGYWWRRLIVDSDGNTLVTTFDIVELSQFSSEIPHTGYIGSVLDEYMNNFYDSKLSQVIKDRVRLASIPVEAEPGIAFPYDESSSGLSKVDKDAGTNGRKVFALSLSDANFLFSGNNDRIAHYNGTSVEWWTRSSGYSGDPRNASYIMNNGERGSYSSISNYGVRPAMWIAPVPTPPQPPVPAISNNIYRVDIDGSLITVATGLPLNSSVSDFFCPVNADTHYIVESVSALPSVARTEPIPFKYSDGRVRFWLSDYRNPTNFITLHYNPSRNKDTEHSKVTHSFAGREKPVSFVGENRSTKFSLSVEVEREKELIVDRKLREFSAEPILCYREPNGEVAFVTLDDFSKSSGPGSLISFDLSFIEVDHNVL